MSKKKRPPQWIAHLLGAICDPDRLEAMMGDLREIYEEHLSEKGMFLAKAYYVINAIGFLRPFAWKKFKFHPHKSVDMLNNYFKILWRTFYRKPIHSLLNLSCLTLGMAAALVILMYLDFELNYDRFHERADNIYRVDTKSIKTRDRVIKTLNFYSLNSYLFFLSMN